MRTTIPLSTMKTNASLIAALDAFEKGYTPIPVHPGKKFPLLKWKQWQNERPPADLIGSWFENPQTNIALVCNGFVTVDIDDAALLDFVIAKCGQTPSIRQTPRGGFHLDYRARKNVPVANSVAVRGKPIDLRGAGGYVLIPPSANEQGIPYRWIGVGLVPLQDLPVFKVSWARNRTRQRRRELVFNDDDLGRRERRALAYVAHIEGAISGQRGHDCTMRVAGVLIQKFRLDLDSALRIFRVWNDTCEPPWSEKELLHKLESAIKNLPKYT